MSIMWGAPPTDPTWNDYLVQSLADAAAYRDELRRDRQVNRIGGVLGGFTQGFLAYLDYSRNVAAQEDASRLKWEDLGLRKEEAARAAAKDKLAMEAMTRINADTAALPGSLARVYGAAGATPDVTAEIPENPTEYAPGQEPAGGIATAKAMITPGRPAARTFNDLVARVNPEDLSRVQRLDPSGLNPLVLQTPEAATATARQEQAKTALLDLWSTPPANATDLLGRIQKSGAAMLGAGLMTGGDFTKAMMDAYKSDPAALEGFTRDFAAGMQTRRAAGMPIDQAAKEAMAEAAGKNPGYLARNPALLSSLTTNLTKVEKSPVVPLGAGGAYDPTTGRVIPPAASPTAQRPFALGAGGGYDPATGRVIPPAGGGVTERPFVVPPGYTLTDRTGRPLFTNPQKEPAPARTEAQEIVATAQRMWPDDPQQPDNPQKRLKFLAIMDGYGKRAAVMGTPPSPEEVASSVAAAIRAANGDAPPTPEQKAEAPGLMGIIGRFFTGLFGGAGAPAGTPAVLEPGVGPAAAPTPTGPAPGAPGTPTPAAPSPRALPGRPGLAAPSNEEIVRQANATAMQRYGKPVAQLDPAVRRQLYTEAYQALGGR